MQASQNFRGIPQVQSGGAVKDITERERSSTAATSQILLRYRAIGNSQASNRNAAVVIVPLRTNLKRLEAGHTETRFIGHTAGTFSEGRIPETPRASSGIFHWYRRRGRLVNQSGKHSQCAVFDTG